MSEQSDPKKLNAAALEAARKKLLEAMAQAPLVQVITVEFLDGESRLSEHLRPPDADGDQRCVVTGLALQLDESPIRFTVSAQADLATVQRHVGKFLQWADAHLESFLRTARTEYKTIGLQKLLRECQEPESN